MQTVQSKKPYVATYKEIIIGFTSFSLVLILLYPKDMLQEQILSESTNYDLSILYLQNMLKRDPHNETLLLALAQQSIKANKKDFDYKVLELLKNSKKQDIKSQAYILSYEIAKQNYIYLKTQKQYKKLPQAHKEIHQIFNTIITNHFYAQKNMSKLYQEAVFLQDTKNQYILLKQILKNEPKNKQHLQSAYYLAYKLHKYDEALAYLDTLNRLDTENKHKWHDEKYYIIIKAYSLDEAEFHLKKEAKRSQYWQKRLISFYLDHKQYKKATKIYIQILQKSSSFQQKKSLWMQAIQTLRDVNNNQDALKLAHTYENYFFRDQKTRVYLLKLYLALNDLQSANKLSKKILNLQR